MVSLVENLRLLGAKVPERRPRRVPSTELPKLYERAYAKLIRQRVLEPMQEAVNRELLPEIESLVRQSGLQVDGLITDLDPWLTTLTKIVAGLRIQLAREISDEELAELVRRNVASAIMVANGELNRRQLKVLLGIDVLADPPLRAAAEGFVAENVSLIKSIPERYFTEIEQAVMRNVRAGRRASVIENEIRDRYPKHASHAKLIARDQTAKLNSQITRKRHEALGVTGYFWRDSNDDRVRPRHGFLGKQSRSGRIFKYESPPVVDLRTGRRGNPGEDFQCRCTGEPAIPGIDF